MSLNITIKKTEEFKKFLLKDISNINEFKYLKTNTYREKIEEYRNLLTPIISKYKHFVILGAGGSVFHINAVVKSLKLEQSNIDVIYNANEGFFKEILNKVNDDTFFILISKNGRSEEVNIFASEMFKKLNKSLQNTLIVTTQNGMKNLSVQHPNCYYVTHEEVSGRFSCFSTPFILPMLLFKKFKIEDFFNGARNALLNPSANSINAFLDSYENGATMSAIISHIEDMTYYFFLWYEQILMESCGKEHAGMDAIFSNGITDMHSKYQMFLQGRRNKVFTILSADNQPNLESIKDLMEKKKSVSIDLIYKTNQTIKIFSMQEFNEYSIGQVMSQLAQEVIHLAHHMNINPFNQPGVEALKI